MVSSGLGMRGMASQGCRGASRWGLGRSREELGQEVRVPETVTKAESQGAAWGFSAAGGPLSFRDISVF